MRPTGFKHTGLFPEQSANWDFLMDILKPDMKVLNLFAYTGGATVACASVGAHVTHVDAAKSMVGWAKENAQLSGVKSTNLRFLVDDCLKFVQRERRRGNRYQAIIMDPPSYGRSGLEGGARFISPRARGGKTARRRCCVLYFKLLYDGAQLACHLQHHFKMHRQGQRADGRPRTSRKEQWPRFTLRYNIQMDSIKILHEDNHLIFALKPAGVPSQADDSGDADMLSMVREYIRVKYAKPGNVYVGLLHRLDRPTSGVMVFAKTSKAASRLSDQFRRGTVSKTYHALVHGHPGQGVFEDYLLKNRDTNIVEVNSGGKFAKLEFTTIEERGELSLVKVKLHTGRSHQIRVQFASRGFPLYGDVKYGKGEKDGLGLVSHCIGLEHPTTKEWLEISVE